MMSRSAWWMTTWECVFFAFLLWGGFDFIWYLLLISPTGECLHCGLFDWSAPSSQLVELHELLLLASFTRTFLSPLGTSSFVFNRVPFCCDLLTRNRLSSSVGRHAHRGLTTIHLNWEVGVCNFLTSKVSPWCAPRQQKSFPLCTQLGIKFG